MPESRENDTDCLPPPLCRPKSKNADQEDPPQEGEPFDFNAKPNKFYLDVESTGNLEPDQIIQEGIKVMQEKIALLLHSLTGEAEDGMNGDYDGPRSPNMGLDEPGWNDQGYTTPYNAGGGNMSAWGGNTSTTPYHSTTTPYGVPGQNGWS